MQTNATPFEVYKAWQKLLLPRPLYISVSEQFKQAVIRSRSFSII